MEYSEECWPYARSKLLIHINSISLSTPCLPQVMCRSNFRTPAKYSPRQNRSCKNTDERGCEVFPMTGTSVTLVSSVSVVVFIAETCCLGLVLQWYNIVGSPASVCLLALQRYHADFSFPYDLVAHKTWHRFLRTQNWNVSGFRARPTRCCWSMRMRFWAWYA
jgi:hypothetical protein